ncbi:MAG: shikimate kinase [Fuerstiella sp.]
MIVTLIGYRGCGKSSVAPLLAERLGCSWIDSDDEVVREAGCTIQQIFSNHGEAEFRRREASVLERLLSGSPQVIAAGGGAILDPKNRSRMRAAGPVVWLQASAETLAARIAADSGTAQQRPSLTGRSVTEEVADVLQQRFPAYQDAATIVVDVDDRSPAEVAAAILERLPTEEPCP